MKTTNKTLRRVIVAVASVALLPSSHADTASVVAAANTLIATAEASGANPSVQTNETLTIIKQWTNLPGGTRNGPTIGGGAAALTTDLSTNVPAGQTLSPRAAALALCQEALSAIGYNTMNEIRLADNVIRATDNRQSWNYGNYHIAILGTPSTNTVWELQISGHHLTYNITYNAPYVSATPMFIGTEPPNYTMLANGTNAVVVGYVNNTLTYFVSTPGNANSSTTSTTVDPGVANGTAHAPLETQRAACYNLATAIQADSSVASSAKLSGTYDDVVMGVTMSGGDSNFPFTGTTTYPTGTTGRGVLYSSLSASEKAFVTNMIAAWVNTQAGDIASNLLADYESSAALNATYIGYAPGTGGTADFTANVNQAEKTPINSQHSYIRIDGPRVWIEFVVQQAVAFRNQNFVHYHSIWRDKLADYGNEFGGFLDTTSTSTTYTRPAIITQPVSASISSGDANTFTVAATGTASLYYQWYSNSVAMANATNSTFTASNAATYFVTVANLYGMAASANATLTVSSANTAPVLSVISDYTIDPGYTLAVTNVATDADSPAQTLTFSLPTAPTNAAIDSSTGVLSWRPLIAQANSTNPFSVVVTDSGSPMLSATQSFTVFVNPVTRPTSSTVIYTNDAYTFAVSGTAGLDYSIQGSTNLIDWETLLTTNPTVLPFVWSDTDVSNYPARFYRVLIGP
jgi:hypothetical protein